jgi:hypothetical protein
MIYKQKTNLLWRSLSILNFVRYSQGVHNVGIPSVLHPDLVPRGELTGFRFQGLQTRTWSKLSPRTPPLRQVTLYNHTLSTIRVPGQYPRPLHTIESFPDSDPGQDQRAAYLRCGSPSFGLDIHSAWTMDHRTWKTGQPPDQCWRRIWPNSSQPDICARHPLETGNLPIWT